MTSVVGDVGVGTRLFLTAAPNLAEGRELSPGHWLEHIQRMVLARQSPEGRLIWGPEVLHVLLELACETVRLREFPPRPSRLDCLYLWANEATARAWHYRKHVLQGSTAGLYEVEVVACQCVFVADMNLVSYLAGETSGELLEQARRYWRGEGGDETGEVLLEGRVVVKRDLLSVSVEALRPLDDHLLGDAVQWTTGGGRMGILQRGRTGRYHLCASIQAATHLPLSIAGWVGIEIEGQPEPILARRGTPPCLIRPGEKSELDISFTDVPALTDGVCYRPLLVCNRSAAHYWQLQPFWEGLLPGGWQRIC